jgi:hypothetical protein
MRCLGSARHDKGAKRPGKSSRAVLGGRSRSPIGGAAQFPLPAASKVNSTPDYGKAGVAFSGLS